MMGMFTSKDMPALRPQFAPREPVKVAPPAKIVLPYPPTANNLTNSVIRGRGKDAFVQRVPTKEAVHYRRAASAIYAASGQRIMEGRIKATLWVYHPRRGCDLENRFKAVFDAGNGIAWADDKQIKIIHAEEGGISPDNPRVELLFEPAPVDAPLFANQIS